MADKTWKAFERKVAEFFGTRRTPGSGSAGTFAKSEEPITTRSDTLHKVLYIEAKRDKNYLGRQLLRLLDETSEFAKKEAKVPVVALKEHGRQGFFLVVHSDYLVNVAKERELTVLRTNKEVWWCPKCSERRWRITDDPITSVCATCKTPLERIRETSS